MIKKNNKTTIIILSLAIIFLLVIIASIKNVPASELSSEDVISKKGELPPEVVADKIIKHINDNFLQSGPKAFLVEVSDVGSVYKITLSIEGMEFDSFATKDGFFLFPEGFDLRESPLLEEPQTAPTQELLDVDYEELQLFVECLKGAGFVIYGADWCGWTTQMVDTFGGWETIKPIYVECTEKQDLCNEKEIMGYPTILVNDEPYQGSRTFEGFSEATGCLAPANSEIQGSDNPAGGC